MGQLSDSFPWLFLFQTIESLNACFLFIMEGGIDIRNILKIFPLHIRNELQAAFEALQGIEEIRVRVCQPIILLSDEGEYFFKIGRAHV